MIIPSYSKVYAVGHRWVKDIFKTPVYVQEKIDGSQFSFMRTEEDEIVCRSKGQLLDLEDPQKLFAPAVKWVVANKDKLIKKWVYRAEALHKPKHNVLQYGRAPEAGFVLYDIDIGICDYVEPIGLKAAALYLGLDCVPNFYHGIIEDFESMMKFMEKESFLGGCKIEGMVFKNYEQMTPDNKTMMAKYVSEAFKEQHRRDPNWKSKPPIHDNLIAQYKTEARWQKAVQHLKEEGKLEGTPKDIGTLIPEVIRDLKEEEEENIKEQLFGHSWGHIGRGVVGGFAEWYKESLAQEQFEKE